MTAGNNRSVVPSCLHPSRGLSATLRGCGSRGKMRLPSFTPTRPAAPRAAVRLLSTARSSGFPLFSPSDLMTFAESPWASWMERHSRERPEHPLSSRADAPDAFMQMLGQKGDVAEVALLQDAFISQGRTVIDLSAERGTKEARARSTLLALAERPDIIYQAPLHPNPSPNPNHSPSPNPKTSSTRRRCSARASSAWPTSSCATRAANPKPNPNPNPKPNLTPAAVAEPGREGLRQGARLLPRHLGRLGRRGALRPDRMPH